MINILNTISGKKEEFVPMEGKKVRMFVCGPTVYDYIHIGNARTFVFFDVVAKYLHHKGYDVNYIQNITDIDNKIIERAQKEGVDPLEYAQKYTEIFKQDMLALGVTSPEYKNATDHIPEVIKQVQTLLDKGNAYVIENDGIYFDLSTFPDYGKLSGRTAEMADDAVSRIDDSDKKRNRGDFALWKLAPHRAEGSGAGFEDPSWPAPFGNGRPGWHIEDTAITEKYFGPQYDIHGGGQDLIFPHHEAEVTQQCAAANINPKDFVKYWMHVAFVVNKEQKMSKSLGNFTMAHQLLEKYPKEVLRFYLLSNHYRSPLDFSEHALQQVEREVNRIKIFLNDLSSANGSENVETQIFQSRKQFFEALDNDFNIPDAFAAMFELIRNLNPKLKFLNKNGVEKIEAFFNEIDLILGVVQTTAIPDTIRRLIEKMDNLRKEKKYEESDKIRRDLENRGYIIRNPSEGFAAQVQTSVIAGVEVKNEEK